MYHIIRLDKINVKPIIAKYKNRTGQKYHNNGCIHLYPTLAQCPCLYTPIIAPTSKNESKTPLRDPEGHFSYYYGMGSNIIS